MSWIAIDDEIGAIEHLLASDVAGPVNLTSPGAVRNAEFARQLAAAVHRPAALPVPKFAPRLLLGKELADNLLFEGQRVEPRVLLADGYQFRHPELAAALAAIVTP
jgi:NAD dependent epimerase/dehydratase family enzyme